MNLIRMIDTPKDEYSTSYELSEYELKEVERLNLDYFIYWYASGDYDGSGFALMGKSDRWDIGYLSHCSCNGPTDDLQFSPSYDSLDALLEAQTDKYERPRIQPLVKFAKEQLGLKDE